MSVMTPEQLRQGRVGQPPMAPPLDLQRQAVVDQLGTTPAATGQRPLPGAQPVASNPGAFARGGQVKQLPGMDTGKILGSAAGTTANVAGKIAGNTAAGAATGMGISMGTDYLGGKLKPKEDMPDFGGEFGDLTDSYGRRFEGAGPGVAGGAVRGAGYGANPGLVAATGGLSVVAGAGIGALIGAITKNAKTAYSDFRVEDAAQIVKDAYKKYLGREASDDEVMSQLVGQGFDPKGGDRWVGEAGLRGDTGVLAQIRDSPEAQAFRTRGATMDQLGAQPETSVPADAQVVSGSASGAGGGGRLEGFGGMLEDGRSKLEASDSPKYQVARILQKYPSTPAGLQQALAEINGLGLGTASIGGSKGDKLTFGGNVDPRFNGITTFDVIRGAGNGGEAWAWQPEGGDAAPAQAATPTQGGPIDSTGRTFDTGGVAGDSDTLARIRAELQRILSGEPNRDALVAGLQG